MSDTRDLATYRNQNLSPFGGNVASAAAYRQSERLVAASHLVTNFIPPHEPVRRSIREKSLEMLGQTLSLREGFRASGPEQVNEIIATLLELSTLFEVANAAGYLSQMNVEILGKVCADMAQYLRSHEDTPESEGLILEEKYFSTAVPKIAKERKGNIKDISIRLNDIKDNVSMKPVKRDVVGKRVRHDAVLKVVREKKRVSIKDVVQDVPGYSEKTIQRELLTLVGEGLVRKEGERRWSVYVLVE